MLPPPPPIPRSYPHGGAWCYYVASSAPTLCPGHFSSLPPLVPRAFPAPALLWPRSRYCRNSEWPYSPNCGLQHALADPHLVPVWLLKVPEL